MSGIPMNEPNQSVEANHARARSVASRAEPRDKTPTERVGERWIRRDRLGTLQRERVASFWFFWQLNVRVILLLSGKNTCVFVLSVGDSSAFSLVTLEA